MASLPTDAWTEGTLRQQINELAKQTGLQLIAPDSFTAGELRLILTKALQQLDTLLPPELPAAPRQITNQKKNNGAAVYDYKYGCCSCTELCDFENLVEADGFDNCDISRMPGIGRSAAEALNDFGINKVGQMIGHLLTFDNGIRDTQEVCQALFDSLRNDVGLAAKTNKRVIVQVTHRLAADKGLIDELIGERWWASFVSSIILAYNIWDSTLLFGLLCEG